MLDSFVLLDEMLDIPSEELYGSTIVDHVNGAICHYILRERANRSA